MVYILGFLLLRQRRQKCICRMNILLNIFERNDCTGTRQHVMISKVTEIG